MYSQAILFPASSASPSLDLPIHRRISGLAYHASFITTNDAAELIKQIDQGNWLCDLKRRVQHFGYKYDYKARKIDSTMNIGKLPDWLQSLAVSFFQKGFFKQVPDQVIVNEYEPGQGISPHIDCEPCFGETLASLSLNSTAIMEFSNGHEKVPVFLEPRSVVLLSGEARFDWTHCIPARKSDLFQGVRYPRKRRISLTFRKVILQS
ncbi:MAG: alpha-ketoglutarate-dependent dioxygenase AlkB [Saprospiraceae bacterium]